ncbi:MAG: aspartyl protease family protein [Phycisphaerae bacterium]
MVSWRNPGLGRFSVNVDLANYGDLVRADAGDIPAQQVRRLTIRGLVDSGATRLVIPESVVRELGLQTTGEATVRYADGHTAHRDMVRAVHLTYGDRSSVFNAVVEPDRDSALIGAIVMEDLDLVVDCTRQTLTPRDPERIISEIE